MTNSASNSVSSYAIAADGTLVLVGSCATGRSPRDMAVGNDFLYVINENDENLSAFRIGSHGSLSPIGFYANSDSGLAGIAISGGFAYIPMSDDKLLSVFAIEPGGGLAKVGSCTTGDEPCGIAAAGGFVYVETASESSSQLTGNLLEYAVHSDGTLSSLGSCATGSGATGMAIVLP